MKILGLETSTEYCSVALWHAGEVDAREMEAGQRHSAVLLGMVDELLRAHSLRAAGLDGIAFGAGPGSFTGLRIACGVAQGMAFGAGIPVAGVSTLLALAQRSGAERAACCLDARMGQVYYAAYERMNAGWRTVHEPGLWDPDATPLLPEGQWTGCGGGFAAHAEALARRHGARVAEVRTDLHPHAREIVELAIGEFEGGRAQPAERAAPLYLRDKVALKTDERAT